MKIICKENKEQRGKRKYHDGTPHPKDRVGFTQDILNVQANACLAAHLLEEPASHIWEEDAEPTEELAGDDFTYSQETTAFQELLALIDSSNRELPSVLSPAHYAFFSCIAERARGIVGQLSDISSRARQLLS